MKLGTDVIVSNHLPIQPTPGEDARRIVRHGLRQWVEYIGETVGPKPGDPTHAFMTFDGSRHGSGTLVVSREMFEQIKEPTDDR